MIPTRLCDIYNPFKDHLRLGDIGVEVEVESFEPIEGGTPRKWKRKNEGSLRGYGYEYLYSRPLELSEGVKANTKLLEFLKDKRIKHDNDRASVHVHTNIIEKTTTSIFSSIIFYWLFENLLFKYCGESREGNLFCMRLCDAQGLLIKLEKNIESFNRSMANNGAAEPVYLFNTDGRFKYSALNLDNITVLGTLEFRGMRGVYDKDIVNIWCSELVNIRNKSIQVGPPDRLMDLYFNEGPMYLLRRVLSEDFVDTLTKSNKNWLDLVEENEPCLTNLAYATEWSDLENKIRKIQEDRKAKPPKAGKVMNLRMGEIHWEVPNRIHIDEAEDIEDDDQ